MAYPNNKRRNNRKNRTKNRQITRAKDIIKETYTCPICEKPIEDVLTAIQWEKVPAHFDCVMKKLEESEQLEENEKLCYLGGGSFGIIQNRTSGGMKFFIRKRIQFEEKEVLPDWRKSISRGFIKR